MTDHPPDNASRREYQRRINRAQDYIEQHLGTPLTLAEIARAEDAHAIEAATKALADGTENFAALRMNRGIQQALTGRRLTLDEFLKQIGRAHV